MDVVDAQYWRDPKYKKYVVAIERTLQSFDAVSEWADIIAFLSRLSKTILAFPQFPVIPCQVLAAKRLAQCLNPALPAGVHLKSLEVYGQVFERIGDERLAEDLSLYSVGLFPLFQHASMLVKPALLALYTQYYLRLGQRLLPCLKAMMLAVLPGMEEENGESFQPVITLLDQLSDIAGPPRLLRVAMYITAQSSQWRLGALNYLLRRLPRFDSREALQVCLGSDPMLVVGVIHGGLLDSNVLVQRNTLELLVVHFPLHHRLFDEATLIDLMDASVSVVLRKEMSLNRRLYSWLMGPKDDRAHFEQLAMPALLQAMKRAFTRPPKDAAALARPFRILLSLSDRADVGGPIVQGVFVTVLESAQAHIESIPSLSNEIRQTFAMFMRMADPQSIWPLMCANIAKAPLYNGDIESAKALIGQLSFLLRTVRADDHETVSEFLPEVANAIVARIQELSPDKVKQNDVVLNLLLSLLSLLKELRSSARLDPEKLAGGQLFRLSRLQRPLVQWMQWKQQQSTEQDERLFALWTQVAFQMEDVDTEDTRTDLLEATARMQTLDAFATGVLAFLDTAASDTFLSVKQKESFGLTVSEACYLMRRLWLFIDVDNMTDVLKICGVVKSMMPQGRAGTELSNAVEDEVFLLMSEAMQEGSLANAISRFHMLWSLTDGSFVRCAYFTMEQLTSHDPLVRMAVELWIRSTVKNVSRILDPIVRVLLADTVIRTIHQGTSTSAGTSDDRIMYFQAFDQKRVLYVITALANMLDNMKNSETFVTSMAETSVASEIVDRFRIKERHVRSHEHMLRQDVFSSTDLTYLQLVAPVLLRFVQSETPETAQPGLSASLNTNIQLTAARVLELLFKQSRIFARNADEMVEMQTVVLRQLQRCLSTNNSSLQVILLRVLRLIVMRRSQSSPVAGAKSDSTDQPPALPSSSLSSSQTSASGGGAGGVLSTDAKDVTVVHPIGSDPRLLDSFLKATTTLTVSTSVRARWVEFLLLILPHLRPFMKVLAHPILSALCEQVVIAAKTMKDQIKDLPSVKGTGRTNALARVLPQKSSLDDIDLTMLIRGLVETTLFCLGPSTLSDGSGGSFEVLETPQSGGMLGLGFITDFVQSVADFMTDDGSAAAGQDSSSKAGHGVRDAVFALFPTIFSSLTTVAQVLRDPAVQKLHPAYGQLNDRLDVECLKLCKLNFEESFAAIIENWLSVNAGNVTIDQVRGFAYNNDGLFALLQGPLGSLKPEVWFKVSTRILRTIYMTKPRPWRSYLARRKMNDVVLVRMIEVLLTCYPTGTVAPFVNIFTSYAREIVNQPSVHKQRFLPLLRLLVAVHEGAPFGSGIEEDRKRKDYQDMFQRVCDGCILLGGRSFDQTSFLRRIRFSDDATVVPSEADDKEKSGAGFAIFAENAVKTPAILKEEQQHIQTMTLISRFLIVGIRAVLDEATQAPLLIVNFMYYVASVYLKSPSLRRTLHGEAFLAAMVALTKNSAWLKYWRREIWDTFLDANFFTIERRAITLWTSILKNAMNADKDKISDLVVRMANTSSGPSLFVSRDAEIAARGQLLRRIAFLVLCGDFDEHLRILPTLFERIVEIFRNQWVVLFDDVFRCLRVLLVKVSHQHLSFFWPVVLTELAKLLATTATQATGRPSPWLMTSENVDAFVQRSATPSTSNGGGSSNLTTLDLQITPVSSANLLAACKFVDLALTMGLDDFQLFQWLFVHEQVIDMSTLSDAIIAMSPSPWLQLALPTSSSLPSAPPSTEEIVHRRPLLMSLNTLVHPQQLSPFAQNLAPLMYKSQVVVSEFDLETMVERILEEYYVAADTGIRDDAL